MHPRLSCAVHPTLLIVFFLMSSKPPFPFVTSCFCEPNLPSSPTFLYLFLSPLAGALSLLFSISFCASVTPSLYPRTALRATQRFGCLSAVGCIDSAISAELLARPHLQRGCKHLAGRIPLISPVLPARSNRGTFQSFRQSFIFLLHPFFSP